MTKLALVKRKLAAAQAELAAAQAEIATLKMRLTNAEMMYKFEIQKATSAKAHSKRAQRN